jgi:hypothetical protein
MHARASAPKRPLKLAALAMSLACAVLPSCVSITGPDVTELICDGGTVMAVVSLFHAEQGSLPESPEQLAAFADGHDFPLNSRFESFSVTDDPRTGGATLRFSRAGHWWYQLNVPLLRREQITLEHYETLRELLKSPGARDSLDRFAEVWSGPADHARSSTSQDGSDLCG